MPTDEWMNAADYVRKHGELRNRAMPRTQTYQCKLGPVRAEIKIDLDESGRLPLGPPDLTLSVEGSTLRTSLLLQPSDMRALAETLVAAADRYTELDANYDKAREAAGKPAQPEGLDGTTDDDDAISGEVAHGGRG